MNQEFGIFALDPGLSSAWAEGIIPEGGTTAERMVSIDDRKSTTIKDLDWCRQARVISAAWHEFYRTCQERGVRPYFVCEDFILTRFGSSDKTGLYPVWVGAAVTGFRMGSAGTSADRVAADTVWQGPGQAKGYATDERLRSWGLWIKGREHERDAWRHFAFFAADPKAKLLRAARTRVHTS